MTDKTRFALGRRNVLAAAGAVAVQGMVSRSSRAAPLKPEKDELKFGFIKLTDMVPIAIAIALADAGASVVVNARSAAQEIKSVSKDIEERGGKALPVLADITDEAAVARMVAAALERERERVKLDTYKLS